MEEKNLKQKTKRALYWKFAEQFSNYGVTFIVGIFMARMLSPSDYGITALPAVFMAIAAAFVEAGFTSALIRKPEIDDDDLTTTFIYSTIVGLLCYVLLFISSPWIADFYNTPVLKPLMRVTALSFIFYPIGVPQTILLKRKLDFKTPAKIAVSVRILSGAVGLTMAYTGYGVWALVISTLFSSVADTILKLIFVRWLPRGKWSKESFAYLWNYGNKMMASGLLTTIYNNITPIIVGKFYSTSDLGIYNRAHGYALLPSQQIHSVVMEVSFPVLSKIQDDTEKLLATYRRTINTSTFVIFPIMMLLAALARPVIIVMITEKWADCIILLQLLCFALMWYPVHGINLNMLMVKGRSDLFLKLEIIKRALGITVMCCSLPFGLVAFCGAQIASSVLSVYINTWYTGKFYDFGFFKQMKDILPTLILGLIMFASVTLFIQLLDNRMLQIILGGLLGVSIYLGGAFLFKFRQIDDVKFLLSRK